mmetsp:Transcript_2160/g.4644  ORF Transcript_2160/g.4644 Transcript_2160/m.4644 type:complete len:92 (-) Transcript_2160:1545-1820(-)
MRPRVPSQKQTPEKNLEGTRGQEPLGKPTLHPPPVAGRGTQNPPILAPKSGEPTTSLQQAAAPTICTTLINISLVSFVIITNKFINLSRST